MYIVQYLGTDRWVWTARESESKDEAKSFLNEAKRLWTSDTWRLVFVNIEVLDE